MDTLNQTMRVDTQNHYAQMSLDSGHTQMDASSVLWSNAAEWLGYAPQDGDDVIIPYGLTVVLDEYTPELGNLVVQGKLIFGETDVVLTADNVIVFGELRAGSEEEHHTHKAEIVLTGHSTDPDVILADWMHSHTDHDGHHHSTSPIDNKAIIVASGGKLELHGFEVNSWTQLSSTAKVGDTSITLVTSPVGWNVGDAIAIAPTDFDAFEVEERTITKIEGSTVFFDKPLEHRHYGEQQNLGNGEVLDMRAEVTNLSRNISITGSDEGESRIINNSGNPDYYTRAGYGGHTVYLPNSQVKIDGVEFAGLGLSGELGGYPVHFHHTGNAEGSYLKNSSIHHTFQRGLVVHRTDNLLVEGNTIFDTMSHAFFIEDGVETGNQFIDNLVMLPRSTTEEFRIDNPNNGMRKFERASGFWITNQANVFEGNHVAGVASGHGFWFIDPDDASRTAISKDDPKSDLPLQKFEDNTAHTLMVGAGNQGYRFDWTSNALEISTSFKNHPDNAAIKDFTAWKVGNMAIQLAPNRSVDIENPILAEARILVQSASRGHTGDGLIQIVSPTLIAQTENIVEGRVISDVFGKKHSGPILAESERPVEFLESTVIGEDLLGLGRKEWRDNVTLETSTNAESNFSSGSTSENDSTSEVITIGESQDSPTTEVPLDEPTNDVSEDSNTGDSSDSGDSDVIDSGSTTSDSPTNESASLLTFALVDAETNEIVTGYENLASKGNLSLSDLDLKAYSIKAIVNSDHETADLVKSVKFESSFGKQIENVEPYALFGDSAGAFNGKQLEPGSFSLKVTAYAKDKGEGQAIATESIEYTIFDAVDTSHSEPLLDSSVDGTGSSTNSLTDSSTDPTLPEPQSEDGLTEPTAPLLSFALVNSETDEVVSGYENLSTISTLEPGTLSLKEFSIKAIINPDHKLASSVESVKFESSLGEQVEDVAPYALFGDKNGNFSGKAFESGDFRLRAEAYSEDKADGKLLGSFEIDYTVLGAANLSGSISESEPDLSSSSLNLSEFGAITFHFDGNNNDKDDIAALPIAAAIAKSAGLEDKITFFYGNNLSEPDVTSQVTAMRESAAFAEKLGIDTYSYQEGIDVTTNKLVEILNYGEKVLAIEGGPMEAINRALEQTDVVNHSNIVLLSHSTWNEDRAEGTNPDGSTPRTWADIQTDFPEVTQIDIADQNGGRNNGSGFFSYEWDWLDKTSNPVLQEARAMMQNAGNKVNDPSDAGMLFYAVTGQETADPYDVRAFFDEFPPSREDTMNSGNVTESAFDDNTVTPTLTLSSEFLLSPTQSLESETDTATLDRSPEAVSSEIIESDAPVTAELSIESKQALTMNLSKLESYGGNQDEALDVSIEGQGTGIKLAGNGWKKLGVNYTITPETILEFEFYSDAQGEIHSIGFDNDNKVSQADRQTSFQLFGTQQWGISDFETYMATSGWQSFEVPVGKYFTGEMAYLTFGNDHDNLMMGDQPGMSRFRNIMLYEALEGIGDDSSRKENVLIGPISTYKLSSDPELPVTQGRQIAPSMM